MGFNLTVYADVPNVERSSRDSMRSERETKRREHLKVLLDERNSLLYWFPKISKLGIPVPLTKWIEIPQEKIRLLAGVEEDAIKNFSPYLEKIRATAKEIGYPVFIRTDCASDKHGWKDTAFVRKEDDLLPHIIGTVIHNEGVGLIGLNYKAIVVREFLELDWRFKAFHGEMPVAKERRYFINNGQLLCHHAYWITEAIEKAHQQDGAIIFRNYIPHRLPSKWKDMLREINLEQKDEVELLTSYAEKVAKVFSEYWSIDFACSRTGEWYLIDMALGEVSYHPSECFLTRRGKKNAV